MQDKSFIYDILAFCITMAAAWLLQWSVTDLVWGLWLSSLSIGYVTIISSIAGAAYVGSQVTRHPEFPPQYRMIAPLIGLPFALFLLGFFAVHFGAFHAAHATFLAEFFPLDVLDPRSFSAAFMNPFALWEIALTQLFPLYGLVVIPILVAERHHVFKGFIDAWQAVHTSPMHVGQGKQAMKSGGIKKLAAGAFGQPYINVIRMHMLIFFFAFADFIHIDSFIVYAVVCLVYFFPWKALKSRTAAQAV